MLAQNISILIYYQNYLGSVENMKKISNKSKASKVKSLKSNSNLQVALLGLAGVAAVILGYRYLKTQNAPVAQPVEINQVADQLPQTQFLSLHVVPSASELELNAKTPVKLVLNAGETFTTVTPDKPNNTSTPNKLVAATVEFSYDPTQITISDVAKGDFFSNTFAAPVVDPSGRKVTFSFGVAPSDGGKSGTGVLATFNVTPKVPGKSVIAFGTMVDDPRNQCRQTSGEARACPMVYYGQQVRTNTDIRAENVEGNLYANLFSFMKGGMKYDQAIEKIRAPQSALSYTFMTKDRISSDIVDDMDKTGDQVNAQDYAQFVLDFNKTGAAGWIRSDINKDGKVNIADYATLVKEWSL
jgi:hypothetical protein